MEKNNVIPAILDSKGIRRFFKITGIFAILC